MSHSKSCVAFLKKKKKKKEKEERSDFAYVAEYTQIGEWQLVDALEREPKSSLFHRHISIVKAFI